MIGQLMSETVAIQPSYTGTPENPAGVICTITEQAASSRQVLLMNTNLLNQVIIISHKA